MAIGPCGVFTFRCPCWINNTLLSNQHERRISILILPNFCFVIAISSYELPICTVPAFLLSSEINGIGPSSAQSTLNTPTPYLYFFSWEVYNDENFSPQFLIIVWVLYQIIQHAKKAIVLKILHISLFLFFRPAK